MIFGNGIAAIPSAHFCWPSGCSKCECAQGKPNVGKKKILAIVAMPLPKMGGKKKSGCRNYMWGIKKKSATSIIFF